MIEINIIWVAAAVCLIIALFAAASFLHAKNRRSRNKFDLKLRETTRELEEQIEIAKSAARAKGEFLSRMSHEIRTPLNAIIGMAQIARTSADKGRIDDCMDKLESSTKHLLGVVNDILDFSKIESGSLTLDETQFSLRQNTDFVVSLFRDRARSNALELRLSLEDIRHDGISADMLRLNQVLINLLSNAIKFTEPGGEVSLTVQELVHQEGESVYRFIVQDSGIGISPDQTAKLFTPFTQANAGTARVYGGTGLGLSISQSIVRMMGGEIELETAPGQGSVFQFTVRVPAVAAAELQKSNDAPHNLSKILEGKRILMVDDIEINREIVIAMLEDINVTIDTAENGKEALDTFCSSAPHHYDLIFMDLQMPVLDGCAATEEIRRSARDDASSVKIIAMTANVLPDDMERAYASGMNSYLSKPFEISTLLERLNECF